MRSLLSVFLAVALGAQVPPTVWTAEAMLQVKRLDSPRPSPDGRRIAYLIRTVHLGPDQSEFRTQIHLAATDGSGSRPLTFADKSSLDPQWSPDGSRLAFRSARGGKMQVWMLRMDGGEAEALTSGKGEVTAFAWSPDGKHLAYTMVDPRSEEDEKRDKAKDDLRWHEERPRFARLYVLDLAEGGTSKAPRLLTPEPRQVGSFDWSPDSAAIAYAHTKTAKADHWTTSDIGLVEVTSGKQRNLATTAAAEREPRFSRDGQTLAFLLSEVPPRWPTSDHMAILTLATGAVRALPPTPDEQPHLLGWAGDGQYLLFTETQGTRGAISAQKVSDGSVVRLDTGSWTVASGSMVGAGDFVSLDPTGRHLAMVVQSSTEPPALAFSPIAGFSPRVVDRPNAALSGRALPRTEVVRWKGPDGLAIEGLLSYPTHWTSGQRVPLLVLPHGGPTQVAGETYVATPTQYPLAAFAEQGFAVLRTNIRGSSGYGRAFRFANDQDWGGKDFQDLMAGVDHVIALGVADKDRLGILGWSYGGFMTSWAITQTHRFKAASVGAGVTNLMSFNGTTDIPSFVPDYFGGDSWEQLDRYRAHSALFQAKGVTTPTLIQHCEGDQRVPISQGYELFNALQRQGVEVRMLVVPRQAHGPTEPRALQRLAEANLDWFAAKLNPKKP